MTDKFGEVVKVYVVLIHVWEDVLLDRIYADRADAEQRAEELRTAGTYVFVQDGTQYSRTWAGEEYLGHGPSVEERDLL